MSKEDIYKFFDDWSEEYMSNLADEKLKWIEAFYKFPILNIAAAEENNNMKENKKPKEIKLKRLEESGFSIGEKVKLIFSEKELKIEDVCDCSTELCTRIILEGGVWVTLSDIQKIENHINESSIAGDLKLDKEGELEIIKTIEVGFPVTWIEAGKLTKEKKKDDYYTKPMYGRVSIEATLRELNKKL